MFVNWSIQRKRSRNGLKKQTPTTLEKGEYPHYGATLSAVMQSRPPEIWVNLNGHEKETLTDNLHMQAAKGYSCKVNVLKSHSNVAICTSSKHKMVKKQRL